MLSRRDMGIWNAAALVLIAAVHATYIPNGFTWLDHGDVVEGRAIPGQGELLESVGARFGETSFYRPLVTLTLALDAAVFGKDAWGFHLTNVVLHAGVCAAFFWFASLHLAVSTGALIGGMVVAGIHPLSWLPVGAISYRPDLLAVLFTFLAVGCYVKARGLRRVTWWYLAAAGTTGLALLSKETALFWIPALLLVRELPNRNQTRRSLVGLGAIAAVCIAYLAVRQQAVPEGWSRAPVPFSFEDAVGTRLAAIALQFGHALDPRLPALSDAMPIVGFGAAAMAGGCVLVALGIGAVRWRRNQVGWLFAFSLIALAPALNVVPLPRFTSPHYGYLVSYGFGLGVALGFDVLSLLGKAWRWGTTGLVCVWSLIAAVSTFEGGRRFHDDVQLFGPEVTRDPRFLEGHHYLGVAARRDGDLERASEHFTAALRFRDDTLAYLDWVSATVSLAEIRIRQGQLGEADRLLIRAEASEGSAAGILYNRALVVQRRGDHERVVRMMSEGLHQRPKFLLLFARSLAALGRKSEAVEQLTLAMPMLSKVQQGHVATMILSIQQEEVR